MVDIYENAQFTGGYWDTIVLLFMKTRPVMGVPDREVKSGSV